MRTAVLLCALLLAVTPAFADPQFYIGGFNTLGDGSSLLVNSSLNGPPSTIGTMAPAFGSIAFNNAGMTFGPGGSLYAISNDGANWYFNSVNPGTGASTQLFTLGTNGFSGLAYDSANGFFYSLSLDSNGAATVDKIDSGAQTVTSLFGTAVTPGFPGGGGLTYDPANNLLYAISVDSIGVGTFYSISLGGASTSLFGLGGGATYSYLGGLTFDPVNGLFYALTGDNSGLSTIATIDSSAMTATLNTALDYGYLGGIAVSDAPAPPGVPEPSTMVLFASGALGLWRRRRSL